MAFVITVFPRDLLLSGVVPDDRLAGDAAAHVIGQRAFIEDSWHWPLLQTTLLNAPAGLNIAMTDSIPLVALPLKLFRFLLPPHFSAIQLWLALAYLLQPIAAVFALRSAGEIRVVPAVAVSLFAIAMPTFLFRFGHCALSSHFILLIALGAYFRMTRYLRGGVFLPLLLMPVSLLIHPYIAFMTFALLAAAPVSLALQGSGRCMSTAITVAASLVLVMLTAKFFGYQALNPGGFGIVSMNLISPFYPAFSYFFGAKCPYIDATGGQFEGYQYLGLGLLLLLLICVMAICFSTRTFFLRRHLGLLLASICLTALAVSNVIYFGNHLILNLGPVPSVLQQLQSSGRLFWPVTYILMVGSVTIIARLLPLPVSSVLLLVAALLQVRDAHTLKMGVHNALRSTFAAPFDIKRLDAILATSTRMTMLPIFGCGANPANPEFGKLVIAAIDYRVAVNTMYVARFSQVPDCKNTEAADQALAPGELRVFLPTEAASGPASVPDGAQYCRKLAKIAICTRRTDLLNGLAR